MKKTFGIGLLVVVFFAIAHFTTSCSNQAKIDYSTQVKPILNKNCISCHGGVKKQGGWSLLFEEEALAKTKSGVYAIVPGDASASDMIRRLTLDDPEERMPYESEALNKEEIDILTQWINEGAEWGEHWAYQAVEEVEVPSIDSDNGIDAFIKEKATAVQLELSPEADPATLARRLSLDIIGFPAADSIIKPYLDSPSQASYEALVDSLLSSPHYGEKWTSMWLDLARYADTKGYERDDFRMIWKYRDWLINAYNDDMPYNQFVTEQLAGDLLPNPTESQLIATAFHRNTMTNDEGGTDNEEFRTAAVMDRVNTTWEALMSTTFACVQCHSHPYDPFRHEEYYKFSAFFNNTRDEDTFADYPVLRQFDKEGNEKLNNFKDWVSLKASKQEAEALALFVKTTSGARNSLTCDDFINAELADTKWLAMRNHGQARLKNVNLTGKTRLIARMRNNVGRGVVKVRKDSPTGEVITSINLKKVKKQGGWESHSFKLEPTEGIHNIYFTFEDPQSTDPNASGIRFDWFYFSENLPGTSNVERQKTENQFLALLNQRPKSTTPIMMENPEGLKRKTHVFERGNWLSLGEEVAPATPALLNAFPDNSPKDRLGLAKWLTSKENPLFSRTMVNRVWEQLFGVGLVETLEDMGTQGANPTHRELLDYLSYEFMNEDAWSLKKLIKKIVMSDTYRQSSKVSPLHLERDADNKYLTRAPRVRLTGEQVRDQALAASGALSEKMFGKPVMPYQPDGIWNSPYNGRKWVNDKDHNQYRRAVYIYWKRTSPYPSMINFDSEGREVCSTRRIRTNTPLQALTTLNDSVYVDLARIMAKKALNNNNGDVEKAISWSYKQVMFKDISDNKRAVLVELFKNLESNYKTNGQEAQVLLGTVNKDDDIAKWAAMTLVCNSIFNLDEVISKT